MIVPNAAAACPYRVGDYLFSENATHPSTSWPGTSWVQVQGRMILGADASHIAGSTGGSEEVTLIEDQLPKISGRIYAGAGNSGADGNGWGAFRDGTGAFSPSGVMQYGQPAPNQSAEFPSGNAYSYVYLSIGGGQPHNNMPPYRAAYIWRRTA